MQFAKKLYFCGNSNKRIAMYKDDFDRSYSQERGADDVFSKPVRAGKRTYFFDVKSTRGGKDFYLTITESKRRQEADGNFSYDKHKIFLYKEDFIKFQEGLADVIEYIKTNCLNGEPFESDYTKPDEF